LVAQQLSVLSRIFGPLFFATVCAAIGFYVGAVVGGSDPEARGAVRRLRAWTGYWLEHRSQSYQQAGQRIYEDRCSVCHGITAGDAAELGRRSFRDYTEMGIYRVIANGQGQADMPAYSRALSERQTLQTVAYLKRLTEHAMSPMAKLGPLPDGEYEYVATDGGVLIYSIDAGFQLVRNIRVVGLREPRGIAVHAESGRLYVPFPGEQSGREPVGRVVAIDLRTEQEVWRQHIPPGIDSLAVTPDGQKIYVPNGEGLDGAGGWTVLDAESGSIMTRISFGRLAHNTQVSQDGSRVYLASIGHDGMGFVDVASDEVIGEIGPFGGVIRPFALTGDGRFALVNVQDLSGFEIADLRTRQVIHRV
jgi:mono/diheme cytochrome c family protein